MSRLRLQPQELAKPTKLSQFVRLKFPSLCSLFDEFPHYHNYVVSFVQVDHIVSNACDFDENLWFATASTAIRARRADTTTRRPQARIQGPEPVLFAAPGRRPQKPTRWGGGLGPRLEDFYARDGPGEGHLRAARLSKKF